MAHELEIVNGEASMVYAGSEVPWHGLGVSVPSDLTPEQMLYAAQLDWMVEKYPLYTEINGSKIMTNKSALVRDRDNSILDIVSNDWNPVQNAQAFGLFYDWVAAGDMTMDTAGSLKNGQIVWALAKIKEGSFEAVKGDQIDSYLLFSNPHQYGKSIEVRTTNIRVVCNNTLTLALSRKASSMLRINHSREFNVDMVKTAINSTMMSTKKYKEASEFLASKRYTTEKLSEYINTIFPQAKESEKEFSRPGQKVFDVMETQPGVEFGEGTWWQAFNAVTYATDHVLGRSADTRLTSAWFGTNQVKKIEAMNLAIEMAGA